MGINVVRVGHCLSCGRVAHRDGKFSILGDGLSILALDGEGDFFVRLQDNILWVASVDFSIQTHCGDVACDNCVVCNEELPFGKGDAVGKEYYAVYSFGKAAQGHADAFLLFVGYEGFIQLHVAVVDNYAAEIGC